VFDQCYGLLALLLSPGQLNIQGPKSFAGSAGGSEEALKAMLFCLSEDKKDTIPEEAEEIPIHDKHIKKFYVFY
ncbi:hypothetical protein A6R68_05469, partial [Neotoma lepida]